MKIVAIIPARMASTRFPGKPLKEIMGLSMIEHVRRRTTLSSIIDDVIVATCDREIIEEVEKHNGKAVMTSDSHERCTERIAEAALSVDADIIINVQGDEPLLQPEMFQPLISPFVEDDELLCANMASEFESEEEFKSINTVKIVHDLEYNALYFSRQTIPSMQIQKSNSIKKLKQLGIMAFRKEFLIKFTKLPSTPMEMVESVDMLRATEHGIKIKIVESTYDLIGVDTPDDLNHVKELMQYDPILPLYHKIM